MSEELNEAIAWLTEHIDMREHTRSERAHYLRKHLDAITAARARIAELEAQHLATQRALVLARSNASNGLTFRCGMSIADLEAITAARDAVAQADGKEAV